MTEENKQEFDSDKKFEEYLKVPDLRPGQIGFVKIMATIISLCVFVGMWYVYNELYIAEA